MIRITEERDDLITLKANINMSQKEVIEFLNQRGYDVKSWLWKYEDETFTGGVTQNEFWTFTATKDGEEQSEDNLYLKVFEAEARELLREFTINKI